MFPSELMIARKTKTGLIFPTFLSEENSDYIENVLNVFKKNIGNKRENIEKELKELEIKSQNGKIIKAISLIFFRKSLFTPPVEVDAPSFREDVFKLARIPPINEEEKNIIIKKVGEKYKIPLEEVIGALYSDKDSEFILREIFSEDIGTIARLYNLEQMETILMKCIKMTIYNVDNWNYILNGIKRLGLLYQPVIENEQLKSIEINGPISMFENIERYGVRFAQIIEKIYVMDKWNIEANIKIKDKYNNTNKEYTLKLSDNISYYLPEKKIKFDDFKYDFIEYGNPLIIDHEVYFPDYIMKIGDKKIYINISSIYYLKDDENRDRKINKYVNWETVYILHNKDKKPADKIYFYDNIDMVSLKKIMENKYSRKDKGLKKTKDPGETKLKNELDEISIKDIKKSVDQLYPNNEKIIEYIESQGLIPTRILPELGYKIKWNGLDIVIVKN